MINKIVSSGLRTKGKEEELSKIMIDLEDLAIKKQEELWNENKDDEISTCNNLIKEVFSLKMQITFGKRVVYVVCFFW